MVRQPKKYKLSKKNNTQMPVFYDRLLLFACVSILGLGLLMVASASSVVSYQHYGQPFHYLFRQLIFLGIGLFFGFIVIQIPSEFWKKVSGSLLIVSFILLVIVLIPGIGREVNGSMRWIGFSGFSLQVSEAVKLFVIIYLASYLDRRNEEVRMEAMGFVKPMLILGLITALLLREPDFGASVVIMGTSLALMFLAGVRFWQFFILFSSVFVAMAGIAISSPYRIARLTTFLNPWAHPFASGYQLTQSLIAFGRGGWTGVGLGESVQKLFYLPEAHTDFLFAVLAEELGLIGEIVVLLLFAMLLMRGFVIGYRAFKINQRFQAYLAFGISMCIGLQCLINIGVNSGVLPTKGLTLPLMSYGGSSLLINCILLALLMRVDYENRLQHFGMPQARAYA